MKEEGKVLQGPAPSALSPAAMAAIREAVLEALRHDPEVARVLARHRSADGPPEPTAAVVGQVLDLVEQRVRQLVRSDALRRP